MSNVELVTRVLMCPMTVTLHMTAYCWQAISPFRFFSLANHGDKVASNVCQGWLQASLQVPRTIAHIACYLVLLKSHGT